MKKKRKKTLEGERKIEKNFDYIPNANDCKYRCKVTFSIYNQDALFFLYICSTVIDSMWCSNF